MVLHGRIQGEGSAPPFFAHVVGFLTLGLKLDPLLDPPFFLVNLRWTPLFKNPGSAPGYVNLHTLQCKYEITVDAM